MRPGVRVVSLALTVCLGLIAVGLLLSGLPIASAGSDIDLVVEMKAPTYVDVGAAYVVNLSYANVGGTAAPDNWVEVTVPPGTQFVEATYAGGAPRPPDLINGSVLAWTLTPLIAHSTWGHILITLQTEDTLPEGETLTPVAHIATSAPEPDTSNNTVGVTTTVSYMAGSVKQVQVRARQAMPGDVLTYTITINLADQPGVGANGRLVTLTDTLPFSHHVRFLGWSGALTGTQHDGQMLSWEGRVWPGEPRVLQYRLGVEGVVTPGTVISNVAMLHWTGHQMRLGPVTTVVTLPYGFMGLGPQQGGQLFHRHGMTLTVPPGAISDTTRFQLGPLFTDTSPVGPPGGLLFANRAFELKAFRFGEPVGHFSAPLSITMNYTDTDVAGLKRETLRMFTRSGPEGPWAELDGPTRLMSGTLTFSTTHLSQFALFGEAQEPGKADLATLATAPVHVDAGVTYEVNVSYANLGWVPALDNWVQVTLPVGTEFVGATYAGGEPRPPDEVDGRVLTWHLELLVANSAWGHILVTAATDEGLPEGEVLEIEAEIGGNGEDSDISNNTASVTSTVNYMAGSVKQVQARHAMPGDVLTYTITINLADQPGVGANGRLVTLTDTLPFSHQVRFLGWSGTLTGTQIDGQMLKWQGRVYPGEPRMLQYRLGVEGVVTPGAVISNVAKMGWTGHQMQLGPVTTVVTVPYGVLGLGPQQGGQLHHRHGMTLTVPPGAISDTTRFQLGPLFTDTSPVGPPGSLLFANRAFELNAYRFGEPVGHFSAPLSITMNYTDTDVAGLKRETLRMFTRSGPEGPWAELDGPTRLMSGTLTFSTTHLSQFALFGEGKHRVYLPLVTR